MAIAQTAAFEAEVGGEVRRLVLRNAEIERFEIQYPKYGIYEFWDQLCGRGPQPQVRHVRDLIALALVGGGMSDRKADDIVGELPPSENLELRVMAHRILGVTFMPAVLLDADKKKEDGSPNKTLSEETDTTSPKS